MSYQANIPLSSDLISISQGDLKNNFTSIGTVFNDATNGNFTKYVIQNVGTPSGGTPVDPASIIHTANGTESGHPELWFLNSVSDVQLTGLPTSATSPGYMKLSNGIILKWGQTSNSAGASSFSFPVAAEIPVFSNVFTVLLQVLDSSASPNTFVYVRTFNTTTVNIYSISRTSGSATSSSSNYLAIGN